MATNLVISQNAHLLLRPAVKLPHVKVSWWKSNPSCWQKSCGLPDSLSPSSTGSLEMNCATGKCTLGDSTGQSHCAAFSMHILFDHSKYTVFFIYTVYIHGSKSVNLHNNNNIIINNDQSRCVPLKPDKKHEKSNRENKYKTINLIIILSSI